MDFLIPFLQVVLDNATQQVATASSIPQQLASNAAGVDANTTGIIATAITAAGGILGKHLYDSKKRSETIDVASDIDKRQLIEIADNYNDYAQECALKEQYMRLVMANPEAKESEILNMVVDDVTKETMGMRLVQFYQNIQKYNVEYYKNSAFKPNSIVYNGKNPLKNVLNLTKDMSTPTPS